MLVVETCQGRYINWANQNYRGSDRIGEKLSQMLKAVEVTTVHPCDDSCFTTPSVPLPEVARRINTNHHVDILVVSESEHGDTREYRVIEQIVQQVHPPYTFCLIPARDREDSSRYKLHRKLGMKVVKSDNYDALADAIAKATVKK